MSIIGNEALAGASGQGGFSVETSLRLRSSASAYLSRTFTSAGNLQTWTWSGWVKRGKLGSAQSIFISTLGGAGVPQASSYFTSGDTIQIYDYTGSAYTFDLTTTQVFRDPSSWYHLVFICDTTNATSSSRVRLYVNGSQITSFSSSSYPTQNANCAAFNNTYTHYLSQGNAQYFDGYLTEVNFIDGQALDSSYFGETDEDTGVWVPKQYTGSYGTNGFYLNFSNNSSTTALGYDQSSNSNNWTCNNISLTSGATYDSMTDVPTLTSEDAANFCTLNPLYRTSYVTSSVALSNGNLKASSSATNTGAVGSMPVSSGKWYFEAYKTNDEMIGWHPSTIPLTGYPGQYAGVSFHKTGNVFYAYQQDTSYGSANTTATIGCAVDFDNQKFYWSINGTWQNSANPAANTGGFSFPSDCQNVPLIPAFRVRGGGSTGEYVDANFGQRPFTYTPPTGFKALNTYNLPDPTIADSSKYFNTSLWTGNGATQSITGLGFQPDMVWGKSRSNAYSHQIFDAVRGATKQLLPNGTNTEGTISGVDSFDSDGFTIGSNAGLNNSGSTFVAWCWKANNTSGSSNTDGSITSTVSADTTSGFSVVTYTGTGSTATVGHGLGITPSMIICKVRNQSSDWPVYHVACGATGYFNLNEDRACTTNSAPWNNTSPTSSVFTVGSSYGTNWPSGNLVAYCFAEIAGYSAFGSYVGNGNADGTFVYLGFRPAVVISKKSSGVGDWQIQTADIPGYNVVTKTLFPNYSIAEATNPNLLVDFYSNGFKWRATSGNTNGNGDTFIYAAFAENPFKYSLAR